MEELTDVLIRVTAHFQRLGLTYDVRSRTGGGYTVDAHDRSYLVTIFPDGHVDATDLRAEPVESHSLDGFLAMYGRDFEDKS